MSQSENVDGNRALALSPGWRESLRRFVEHRVLQRFIIGVIILNGIVIGLETSEWLMARVGGLLQALDTIALGIFVVEIGLKIVVYRLQYFKNAWNLFDFTIVAIALVPAGQGLSVLRSLRILRALRLMSAVPKMRMVVQGLLSAIPAMGTVVALLALVFYVFAVIATKLFGTGFPDWFGTVGASLYSLFQIMTLESWSMGIVRPVMEVYPYAWAYFVPFILVTSFTVLNLFIAIIVNAMQQAAHDEEGSDGNKLDEILSEIARLRGEVAALRNDPADPGPKHEI